ncbi:VG15 protein [Gordonia polyisoprenivorans]|uniref:VG15 protein n=1 Tax=Gordonia polyisoprenivorans TaxID=84595 RepID=UPI003F879493
MSASPPERKRILAELVRLAGGDLATVWRRAETLDSNAFRAFLLDAFPVLTDPYAAAAANLAATWYDDADPASRYVAQPGPLPIAEQLQSSATWALNTSAGSDALALLAGTLQRAIFDAARNTTVLNVESEPGARWARHASANACEFCRMLATRSAVYASKEAATRVVGRGQEMSLADQRDRAAGRTRRSGSGQFLAGGTKTRGNQALGDKYHDYCHCTAIEVRPGHSYEPAPYVEQWEQQYQDARDAAAKGEYGAVSAKNLLAAWRKLDHP